MPSSRSRMWFNCASPACLERPTECAQDSTSRWVHGLVLMREEGSHQKLSSLTWTLTICGRWELLGALRYSKSPFPQIHDFVKKTLNKSKRKGSASNRGRLTSSKCLNLESEDQIDFFFESNYRTCSTLLV